MFHCSLIGMGGLSALLAAASWAPQDRTGGAPSDQAGSDAVLVAWQGPDSAVTERGYFRVQEEEDWIKLWERHIGKPAERDNIGRPFMPRVNFERCMVVAIFQGEGWNSNGVTVESISQDDERILLRFDESTYQTAGIDGGGVKCRAFGIFVLPKSDKPIVIEENVQGLIGHPAQWRERARLQ